MPRVTDLGITIGLLPAGPTGSVLDVPAVTVNGRDGNTSYQLPARELAALMRQGMA
jgi:hypothetical protein